MCGFLRMVRVCSVTHSKTDIASVVFKAATLSFLILLWCIIYWQQIKETLAHTHARPLGIRDARTDFLHSAGPFASK